MSVNTRILSAILVALLCAGGAYFVSQHLVEKVTTERTPPGTEARNNPLLAAERYLLGMGQEVQSVQGDRLLRSLPPVGDSLLLYRNRTPMSEARLTALTDWVHQGGGLIMDAAQLWHEREEQARSPLLGWLGAGLTETPVEDESPVPVLFEDESEPVGVHFNTRRRLTDNDGIADAAISSESGFYLLQYHYGDGMITLINDLSFISNQQIGKAEHAWFLHTLASTPNTLWLLYDPSSPSLLALAWRHANHLVISVFLLTLFGLWAGNLRFGPLIAGPVLARRSQRAHIEAQGRFDFDHGLAQTRLDALRASVQQHWLSRHPVLETLDPEQRSRWIAEHTQQNEQTVHAALHHDLTDGSELTRYVSMLQQLHHWNP